VIYVHSYATIAALKNLLRYVAALCVGEGGGMGVHGNQGVVENGDRLIRQYISKEALIGALHF